MQPHPPFPLPLLLLFLSLILPLTTSFLYITDLRASTLATYTIQFSELSVNISANSIVQLQLPFQYYSADDLHAHAPYGLVTLAGDFCPIDCGTVAVQYSGFVFNITGLYTTWASLEFKVSIGGIPNPRTAVTVPAYTIRVIDATGVQQSGQSATGFTFVPKTMSCTAIATDTTTVGFVSTAYITIYPLTNPAQTPMKYIKVQFPSNWTTQPLISTALTTQYYCMSPTQPSLLCRSTGRAVIIERSTFSSSIDFQIHSLTNPTSMMLANSINVTTLTANSVKLDTCTVGISGFTSISFYQFGLAIGYDSNTTMTMSISVRFPMRVPANTIVTFTVPSQVPLNSSTCLAYSSGSLLPSANPTFSSPNTITITLTSTSQPQLTLNCTSAPRPRSALTLNNLTISSSYNGSTIATISCCSTVLQARNSLTASVVTNRPFLQMSNAQYTVQLGTTMGVVVGDVVYVYFPYQYAIAVGSVGCSAVSTPAVVSSTPTCIASTGNIIKITSLFTSPSPTPISLTLTFPSLQNPPTNPSTTAFQIHLLTSQLQTIEYNSNSYVSISQAIINNFTVSTNSTQTLDFPVRYTVGFGSNGVVLRGYYVGVGLPGEVGIGLGMLGCVLGGIVAPCWYNGTHVIVRSINDYATTTLTLIIDGCINPQSLAPTQNFTLTISDPQKNPIQTSNPTLQTSLTMLSTKPFKHIFTTLLPTSLNSSSISSNPIANIFELNTLQLVLVSPVPFKSTHRIVIGYDPVEVLFGGNGTGSNCSGGVCGFGNGSGTILVTGLTVGSDTLFLNITSTIGLLMKPTLTLTLTTSTNNPILQSTQPLSQYLPDIITYNLTQTSYEYSSPTNITLDYTLTSMSSTGLSFAVARLSYLLVVVPREYGTGVVGNLFNVSVGGGGGSGGGSVGLSGITNPSYTEVGSGFFYVEGYESGGQLVAISVDNKRFQTICTLPCRTCPTSSPTSCLSCYTTLPNFLLFTNSTTNTSSCVQTCPRFYSQNTTTSTCQPCDPNCYECQFNVSTKCLSCSAGMYLFEVDYRCYVDCPVGFYQVGGGGSGGGTGGVCRACAGNCLSCLNQTYCYSCAGGYYLYNNKCLVSCPPSTYNTTLPSLTCTTCPIPFCQSCSQTQCQTCTPPYILSSNQCHLTCPFPLLPTVSGICKPCECATCSNYANNCTSCNVTVPYLYHNYCYLQCPDGMYAGIGGVCRNCTSGCVRCSGNTVCLLCGEGYAIMSYGVANVACVTVCPNTTISTMSAAGLPSCLACTPPCATCNISVTFCLTCTTGYNLHNHECLITCPSPYHPISSICQKCISICQSCLTSDPYNCTECHPNYYLLNNSCYTSCPTSTYTDILSKQCLPCSSVCHSCANSLNCTSCVSGYFLFNWFCYNSCPTIPVLYYQYNGVCLACQPQCVSCVGSPVACTACSHSDYLYNVVTKACLFQCQLPYYRNGSYCVGCQFPCLTCDTTWYSCSTCTAGYYLYNGTCVSTCPSGYYKNTTSSQCNHCIYPCKLCIQNQCLLCQSFAYIYGKQCVLVCPSDMPYEQPGYCSQCIGIGFCARCTTQPTTSQQICNQCVYPYVLFDGNCLNQCPVNYTAGLVGDGRVCEKSSEYLEYLRIKEEFNRPVLPPFLMVGIAGVGGGVVMGLSQWKYRFTYHVGFMISLLVMFNSIFTYYSLYFITTRYQGQYIPIAPKLPTFLLTSSIILNNILLTISFYFFVLYNIYTADIRYQEWKQRNSTYWWILTILMIPLGGHRLHKLNYSKLFGLDRFSYRIVSVEKFYEEDVVTYWSALGDLLEIVGGAVGVVNVAMGYNGIFFIGYQLLLFKLLLWGLLLYDLKKPDRGFFIGDEEEAEEQIRKEMEEEQKQLNRMDTENFAKLVRTKSAYVLKNQKYWGNIDIDDLISVYNPQDYEEVIKVPNKKIQKNIYKGKYRKGRKITIEQKLNKFVDSIKPRPQINKKKVNAYLHKLIYWKPPEMRKVVPTKEIPPSENSMLALLEKKQMEYKEELDNIELVEEQKQRRYYARPRYDQRTFLDDLDETIPNETAEFFYPSSFDTSQKKNTNSIDFDDLLNLNYARRKHLEKNEQQEKLQFESKRKLHHQPQKKRRNLKGFGQMVLKNQY